MCPQRTRPLLAPGICGKWEREFVALVSSLWEENPRASVGWGGAAQHAELLSFPSCCCWKRPGGFLLAPHTQDSARSMQGAAWHPLPYSFISGSWEAFRRRCLAPLCSAPAPSKARGAHEQTQAVQASLLSAAAAVLGQCLGSFSSTVSWLSWQRPSAVPSRRGHDAEHGMEEG